MKALVIAIVCVGLAVVVATIIIGSKTFDGTVVDKPYERGIQWDKTQKALKDFTVTTETKTLGRGPNLFVFSIKPNVEPAPKIDSVAVTVTKPVTTRFDWTYEAKLQPDGRYNAIIDVPDYGPWEIRVSFVANDLTLSYTFSYYVR